MTPRLGSGRWRVTCGARTATLYCSGERDARIPTRSQGRGFGCVATMRSPALATGNTRSGVEFL